MLVSVGVGLVAVVLVDHLVFLADRRLVPGQRMVYSSLVAFVVSLVAPLVLWVVNPDLTLWHPLVSFPFGFQPAGHINEYEVAWFSFLSFQWPIRVHTVWVMLVSYGLWVGCGVLGAMMGVWILYRVRYMVFSLVRNSSLG